MKISFRVGKHTVIPYLFLFRLYYIIGWGLPVLMTTAWAVTTGIQVDSHCWFGYNHTYYYWIVEGPRLALIAVRNSMN